MGYPTTVQLISRQKTEQWYVNFPAAVARALDFKKGEIVEWTIESRRKLVLMRKPGPKVKSAKKRTTKKSKKS